MSRQNSARSAWYAVFGLILLTGLGWSMVEREAAAQPAPQAAPATTQPASQPASQPTSQAAESEAIKKLMELREHPERLPHKTPPTRPAVPPVESQPAGAPAEGIEAQPAPAQPPSPQLDELKRRAQAASQQAAGKPVRTMSTDDDDFVGPPYPPATPPELVNRNGHTTQPAGQPEVRPVEAAETKTAEAKPSRTEPPVSRQKADDYFFDFQGMPWEDVVRKFAEQIGKPLMTDGELVIGGELTYKSDRKFTKDEAIDELNFIMQMKGFRFVETENHIFIVPLNELSRQLQPKDIYASRAEFEKAKVRTMDYVCAYIQVADRAAAKVQAAFETMFPDYMTIKADTESNQLKLVGTVKDIRNFLTLMDRIDLDEASPAVTRIFQVKTNARDVEALVRNLLIGSTRPMGPTLQRDPATGRVMPVPAPAGAEEDVRIQSDDRTNTVIVRATPAKLKEIEDLITRVDVIPDIGEFKTKVVPIENANASNVADMLSKIFLTEQGQAQNNMANFNRMAALRAMNAANMNRRGGMPNQPGMVNQPNAAMMTGGSPEDLLEGSLERVKKTIRIAADERTNSLIVYANDDGQKRVAELIQEIDKVEPTNFRTFKLEHAEAQQIFPTVSQIVQNIGSSGSGRGASVVLDETNNQFHVFAEREQMKQIEGVIKELDVAAPEGERHVVELQNLSPSKVAPLVQQLLKTSGGTTISSTPRPSGRFGGRFPTATPMASATIAVTGDVQVIPLDEAQLLIVVCPAEQWEKVEETIRIWDEGAKSNTPHAETFTVTKGDPQAIVATLRGLYPSGYNHPALGRSNVLFLPEPGLVTVYAIKPAMEEIKPLIEALDREDGTQLEIVPLVNADASQVADRATQLFGQAQVLRSRGGMATGGGGSSAVIQAEPVTNSLIVQADAATLEKIKDFALKMDQKIGAQATEQRFYTMHYAQAQEVANAVQNIFGPAGRPIGRGASSASQIRALASGTQVIVEAPKEKFAQIEQFITQLDDPRGKDMEFKTVTLPGCDVMSIAQTLTTLIRNLGVRADRLQASVTPDPTTDSLFVIAPKEMMPKIDEMMAGFTNAVEEQVRAPVTIEPKYADPNQLAQMINAMYAPKGGQRPDVQVTVSNGMLVIKASKKKVDEIRALIDSVDAGDKSALQVKTYKLKLLNATQVAAMAQVYLKQTGTVQRNGKLQPGAFPEPTTNTLIVIAPSDQLPFIDALIAQLETPDGKLTAEAHAYVLKNARADQVAQNVQKMLEAKVTENEGPTRKSLIPTAVFSDAATNRLFVYTPPAYQDLAADLIKLVDQDVETGEIVHIVQLQQADATQLAQTLDKVLPQAAGGKGPGAGSARSVRITADANSNSLLLAGLPKDIAEIESYITELEGKSEVIPELQIFQLRHSSADDVAETLGKLFVTKGGGKGALDSITITPDDSYNRLLVTASKRKMRQVEAFIDQLDAEVSTGSDLADPFGREMYFVDVYRGNAWDIAWEVQDFFAPPSKGGPDISADWFGEQIKVKCRPEDYDRVVAQIRKIESNIRIEKKVAVFQIKGNTEQILAYLRERMGEDKVEITDAPERATPPTIVESLYAPGEEPLWKQRQREREKERNETNGKGTSNNGRIRPFKLGLPVSVALLGDDLSPTGLDQEPPATRPSAPRPTREAAAPAAPPRGPEPKAPRKPADAQPPLKAPPAAPKATSDQPGNATSGERPQREKTRIVRQPDGSVIIYGPKDDVEEVQKSLDLLQEETQVGEVIRIFEFKYGDVSAAAEVLNIMFNDRQATIRMPNVVQPQQGGQPGQAGGQQGQRNGRGQGGQGAQGRENEAGGGMMEQLRQMTGMRNQQAQQGARGGIQTGGQRIRIATDPGHNYLIVKCEENELPDIKQLLRELDIPPGEVELKVFQLKNLAAEETAEEIKDVLGINKAQRRSSTPTRRTGAAAQGGANPQQQLMEMLQQQSSVVVPGVEGGAKVERVEIVPNAMTNSLLVSAPPEVMTLIEKVINEVEELGGRDVVGIYYQPLKVAKLEDVLPLLQEIFSAVSGSSGGTGGGPGRGAAKGGAPGSLGPVTLSGDPRTNTIIFTAEGKDVDSIRKQIELMDIDVVMAEAETYVCKFGDATAIASAVEAIYGSSAPTASAGPEGGRRRPGGGTTASGQELRIVAEPATNAIVVWAPEAKRKVILDAIQQMDNLNHRDIREIDVQFADPEKLADTLLQMFSGSAGAGGSATPAMPQMRGGRFSSRTQRSSGATVGGITITGDKNSKKLLVRAPDQVFTQIEQVARTLDQPNKQMSVRKFALKHADAEFVVEAVKNAVTELAVSSGSMFGGGGEMPTDPFTAVADPRTNSVLVVGSEQTFQFVEMLLKTVDVETPEGQRKDFRVYVMDKADPEVVADAINELAAGGASSSSGGGSSGMRRSMGGNRPGRTGMFGISTPTPGRELNVYAIADSATRTVMVYGRPEDIDAVEDLVITKYEDTLRSRMQIAEVPVANVKPSELVSFITQFIGEPSQGGDSRRQGGGARAGQGANIGPQIIPNDAKHSVLVRGSSSEIKDVRDLIEQFDDKDILVQQIKVVEVPPGQDVNRLASDIERVVNAAEDERVAATGGRARQVTIAPDEYTHSLIVVGEPAMFGMVTSVIDQLAAVRVGNVQTRIFTLTHLSADDAQKIIEGLQKRGGTAGGSRATGGSRSRSSAQPSSGGSTTPRPSSGGSMTPRQSRPSRPTGGGGGGGGRGDATWSHWRDLDDSPWHAQPLALLTPYVSVSLLRAGMGLMLTSELLGADQDPPPTTQPNKGTATPPKAPAQSPRATPQPSTRTAPPPKAPAAGPIPAAQPKAAPAERAVKPGGNAPPTDSSPAAIRARLLHEKEQEMGLATTKPAAKPEPPRAPAPQSLPVAVEPREPAEPEMLEDLTGISGELRGEVTAAPLGSKQIVITGDENDLNFIEQVLSLMEATTPAAQVEVFPLKNTKAAALATVIDKVIKSSIEATTRTPGPADKFSINAEARSNSLIVAASETIMAQIAELIDKLDTAREPVDYKLVPLRFTRAAEVVAMLRPTIEKLNKIRDVPAEAQASIDSFDNNNSVLIIGTDKDKEDITQLIQAVDVEIKAGEEQMNFMTAEVMLMQLQNGVAEDIAKTLTSMIEEQQKAAIQKAGDSKTVSAPFVKVLKLRLADGRELPELNLTRPIKVIAEKGTNSLIIFSSKNNNAALQEIVRVFDTLPVGADTEVKAFVLTYANAEDISKLLDTLFKDKGALKRPSEGSAKDLTKGELPPVPPGVTGKGLPYNVTVQHDVRSNTVIVIGRKDAVLLAASIVAELDKPSLELGMRPHLIQLKNMTAATLADKMTKFLDDRAKALGVDKNKARDNVVITPDDRTNALVVVATNEMFDLVQDLALELDTNDPYRVIDTRFRRLQYADAQKLQGLLKEVFDKKKDAASKQSKDNKDSLDLVADTRSNSLILTGTRDYLVEADSMIDNLDQKFDPTVVFVVRPVKLNSAANIAGLLKDMVDKATKETDSKLKGTPIYVSSDPLSDSLLLAASQEDMTSLMRWVDVLDRPTEVGRMTRIIPLRHVSADDVSKSADKLFKPVTSGSGSSGSKGLDISISADTTTNSVIVVGPPAMITDIEDFVRKLDAVESTGGTQIRIFKLEQADAQTAGNLLTNILDLRGGSVGGRSSGGSSGGGSSGSNNKDTAKQVMLVLQHQHPELGLETLKGMRSDIRVISDLRTNSLVVTAPAESMPLMEALVAEIDVPPAASKVRAFKLRNADADQMRKTLEELFAQKQATSTSGSSSTGSNQEQRTLTLGEGLGGQSGQEEISFTTDVRTNSVIAAGTKGYLDLVEELVLQLDTQPIEDRAVKVYAPRSTTADDLAQALVSYSDKEKARIQELGKDISLSAKQEMEILAVSAKTANRVIIGYSPRRESEVMDIVRELDQPPPQVSIEVLIIEVTTDNALELGVEFAAQDLNYTKAGANDTTTFDYVGGTDVGAAGSGLGGFTFTITGRDFNFLLRTLQTESLLNVLSRPRIVAMDNQEADFEITQNVPRVGSSTTTSSGQIQTSVTSQDVGIKLKVTPQINPDGYVRMKIRQEVSDVTDSNVTVAPGVTAPIFFQRIADTTVTVRDNETVVLGGLIQQKDSKSENKIPLIGDVPILGVPFRYQKDETRKSELLVVLTPRVIRAPEDYRALSLQARDETGLIPDDVKVNPLMRGLQVQPAEGNGTDETGAGAPEGYGPDFDRGAKKSDEYGPTLPAGMTEPKQDTPTNPDEYGIPVSLLTKKK